MAQPYVGQIMIFGGNFAPAGWMLCAGQLLPISENETLFQLIGTTYGGDGQSTFGLPDLQGRVPLHMGQGSGLSNYVIGQASWRRKRHADHATDTEPQSQRSREQFGRHREHPERHDFWRMKVVRARTRCFVYAPWDNNPANMTTMLPASVQQTGGNQPHENRQPLLVLNFIISLFGVFPSQN